MCWDLSKWGRTRLGGGAGDDRNTLKLFTLMRLQILERRGERSKKLVWVWGSLLCNKCNSCFVLCERREERGEVRVTIMLGGRWVKMSPSVLLLILHYVFICKKFPLISSFSNWTPSSGREFRVLQLLRPASSKIPQLSTARVRAFLLSIRWVWRLCCELHTVNFLHDKNLQAPSQTR